MVEINTFIATVPLVTGAWLCISSLLMSTKNFGSAIFFKVIPMSFGLCSIFVGLKLNSWI